MTTQTEVRSGVPQRATRDAVWRKQRHSFAPRRSTLESAGLFAVATTVYAILGCWLIFSRHIVVYDGFSRLSHAYFVWWNAPPKLTAVGFVWPPIATLVFLPLAAVKPLATSLVALPLTSAVFGGLLLVVVDRLLALPGLARPRRYAIVAAFGANPMIAFYAANGMAEIVYLFLLLAATFGFFRWYLTRQTGPLIMASVCFSLGILTRYEVFTWAALVIAALTLAAIRQRVTRSELEGLLLAYLAPICYGIGLWLFFNWLILGNPVYFLSQQVPGAANTVSQPVLTQVTDPPLGGLALLEKLVVLNLELFPLTLVVVAALTALALRTRGDSLTLVLIAMIVLNAAFTFLIVTKTGANTYLQLRYNMRAMPLALVAVVWLMLRVDRRFRTAIWLATLVILVVSIPLTAHAMTTFRYQYLDREFVHAITRGEVSRNPLGPADETADWIKEHVNQRDAVLTDDSQTFSVMIRSGRPDLFWDRIDRGDDEWTAALAFPFGATRYLLIANRPEDRIAQRYPTLASGVATRGFTRVFANHDFVIVRVAAARPREPRTP